MRCLNLAEYLSDLAVEICFVVRELEGNVIHLLKEKQFQIITLPVPDSPLNTVDQYEQSLGVSQTEEIRQIEKILLKEKPDWVIVDHYALGLEWEKVVKSYGPKLFVIDDIFRKHSCDGFLDQNFHKNHSEKIEGDYTNSMLFLGPHYALLSSQYRSQIPRKFVGPVRRILVFFGGIDPGNETSRLLRLLPKLPKDITYNVVIGNKNPNIKEVSSLASSQTQVRLHIQTKEMAKIISESDLFVGAGGSITWERCFLGLPAACMAVADNQIAMSESLAKIGVHRFLGLSHEISDEYYLAEIRSLIDSESERENLRRNSLALQVSSRLNEIREFFSEQSNLRPR